eukprot:Anaeramoba_ignava/c20333_g2_i1.p1 GENE.c20333_g2_i1~~c20333_g2_i1.p1  ORF type:complete len:202 (+),score=65.49 c20333_g2_i1:56-661(+)
MKQKSIKSTPNTEIHANIFSRLTFSWFGLIPKIGYKRQLVQSDLFELRPQDNTSAITTTLEPYWQEERKKPFPKLMNSLKKQFKKNLLLGGIPKFLSDTCAIINPLLLQQLIKYMSDSSASKSTGIILIIFLFLTGILRTFFDNTFLDQVIKVGYRARSGLTSLIYRKSLLINRKITDPKDAKKAPPKPEPKKEEELKKRR